MEKKTPLYDRHIELGGKIVPFAGYMLPIQYPHGIIKEHMAVRTAAGLFDVSHMGELMLKGPDALKNLQYVVANDCDGMADGQCRYTPLCNENGGIVDDLLVCRVNENAYLLVVNAANKDKDFEHIKKYVTGDCVCEDISEGIAQFAIQGPKAPAIIKRMADENTIPKKYYTFTVTEVAGVKCLLSRTGYTGELGYELYCANEDAVKLWNALLNEGEADGLIPCGLGARDTLRLEASMPLYGHEMNDEITPFEAGIDFFVKMDKADFVGKSALIGKENPLNKRYGIKVTGRGVVREECEVLLNGEVIGKTTSGTHCPAVGPVAMALLKGEIAEGTKVEVEVRGRKVEAEIVPMPFYKRPKTAK